MNIDLYLKPPKDNNINFIEEAHKRRNKRLGFDNIEDKPTPIKMPQKRYEINDDIVLYLSNDLFRIPYYYSPIRANHYWLSGEKMDDDDYLKKYYNPDTNEVRFLREWTLDERKFMTDYEKLEKYKTAASIDKYDVSRWEGKPREYETFIKLKEIFKNNLLEQKKAKAKKDVEEYTPEKSKEHLTNLIKNREYNQASTKIQAEKRKEISKLDKLFQPDLFKERQKQLKPEPELNKTITTDTNTTGYPYRSANKLKSLYDEYDETKVKHYNNINEKQSKKTYSLKAYSKIPNSYIGDLFFEGKDYAFLLLININTRFAYAYKLGKVETKEIINIDDNKIESEEKYATLDQKSIKALIKAFYEHLKQHPINMLRFDGERAINSPGFQEYLNDKNIKFVKTIPNVHTSLGLIERLCRTIRDIAFNLGYEPDKKTGKIITQNRMTKILRYYNEAKHDTLTSVIFNAYPELKTKYKFISPSIMEHNPELEKLFVKECVKYNFFISSQNDFELNKNDIVKVVSEIDKLGKRRAILDKDDYYVVNKIGNVYELMNTRTNKTIYKPRFEIKI